MTSYNHSAPRPAFLIADGADPMHVLHLAVVRPLPYPTVDRLQPAMLTRRRFVFLRDVLDGDAFHVTVSDAGPLRPALLLRVPVGKWAFELLDDPGNLDRWDTYDTSKSAETRQDAFTSRWAASLSETIALWGARATNKTTQDTPPAPSETEQSRPESSVSPVAALVLTRPPVSMRRVLPALPPPAPPPRAPSFVPSTQTDESARNFVVSRYYSTLYSLTTPLSYFAKNTFGRLHSMCRNDPSELREALAAVLLSPEQLGERQHRKLGLPCQASETPVQPPVLAAERDNQAQFAAAHAHELADDTQRERLVLDLKVREAQLQILVVLECVLCTHEDETEFLQRNARRQEQRVSALAGRPLVRKRRRNRILPTLLGHGVPDPEPVSADADVDDTLYTLLLSLIDQLGTWAVLLGKPSAAADMLAQDFLEHVLVPYYHKRMPATVSFVVKTFRSLQPSFKSKPPRAGSGVGSRVSDASSGPKRVSKFAKTAPSPRITPFLKRGASSIASTDLQPPISLKRSKSSFGTKNMQKRQVDMLASRLDPEKAGNARATLLFLFGDARKTRSVSTAAPELPQVEVTPRKPEHAPLNGPYVSGLCNDASIPRDAFLNSSDVSIHPGGLVNSPDASHDRPELQVFATPSNIRVVDNQNAYYETQIVLTPRPARRRTVLEQLCAEKETEPTVSSPLRSPAPGFFFRSNQAVPESPENAGSPVKGEVRGKRGSTEEHGPKEGPINKNLKRTAKETKPKNAKNRAKKAVTKQKGRKDALPEKQSNARTKQVVAPAAALRFDNLDMFNDTPSTTHEGLAIKEPSTNVPSTQANSTKTRGVKAQNDANFSHRQSPTIPPPDFSIPDSDLDSDLDRLLAAATSASFKKYPRKK